MQLFFLIPLRENTGYCNKVATRMWYAASSAPAVKRAGVFLYLNKKSRGGSSLSLRYTLGLDIGIASVGWAVLKNDINGVPIKIEDLGAVAFSAAEPTGKVQKKKSDSKTPAPTLASKIGRAHV